jgi:hypothetical protein
LFAASAAASQLAPVVVVVPDPALVPLVDPVLVPASPPLLHAASPSAVVTITIAAARRIAFMIVVSLRAPDGRPALLGEGDKPPRAAAP